MNVFLHRFCLVSLGRAQGEGGCGGMLSSLGKACRTPCRARQYPESNVIKTIRHQAN